MDIILVNPGTPENKILTEHLGILSLKSYVIQQGFHADILDMGIEDVTVNNVIKRTLKINPKMVGFSLLDDNKRHGISMIKNLRKNGYNGKIVVGGYFPTFSAKELLRDYPQIDFAVRGEGELTLTELLERVIKGTDKPYSEILGLTFRNNDSIIENPPRPLIKNLDMLPHVDRQYAETMIKEKSSLRIYGTRGCWGQCSFCDIIGFYGTSPGKKWRRRSTTHLVNEIETLIKKYNTNYFIFNDDQFLMKGKLGLELVSEFVKELKKRKLDINFELMCRADSINKTILTLLKSAGLKRIFLGLESFDKHQLERYNKKISVRQNLKAVVTLYQLKIDVIASVILADAFTTFPDLIKQFIMLFMLRQKYFNSKNCQISVNKKLIIHKGSKLYSDYKTKGILNIDNYMDHYGYHLKFWTNFRLILFSIEEKLTFFFLRFIKKITAGIKLAADV